MKLPSQEFLLSGGLVCPTNEVDRAVWQEHVVKHPLGVNAIATSGGRASWNLEGWDRLEPPTITESERVELVREIAALADGKLRCEVPEFRGKKAGSDPDSLACLTCQAPVVVRCDKVLNGPAKVGERYRDVTESLLAQLTVEAGVQVTVATFHEALHRLWRTPEKLTEAVVLTVGLDARQAVHAVARISRGDGVRAEFYFERPDRLRWRTTYREFVKTQTGPEKISFLMQGPRPAPALGRVSELCVVARRWWEAHGI